MNKKGFTLIELMVVIAIMGILASLAIPAFQDYMIRARVTEGLNVASVAKTDLEEYYLTHHEFPAQQESSGFESPEPTANVSSIKLLDHDGAILIEYTKKAGDGSILLTPIIKNDAFLGWDCRSGTLPKKYRPAICR